jgi:hypothetical protein
MPLPEGYLPRKGDVLMIQVRVNDNYDIDYYQNNAPDMISVHVVGSVHRTFYVGMDQIHALHCRKWNEGDRVMCDSFHGPGEVVATHGDSVWIKTLEEHEDVFQTAGCLYTIEANELQPYVEPLERMTEAELMAALEPLCPPCGGAIGSQSIVGDDDPISARDGAANR